MVSAYLKIWRHKNIHTPAFCLSSCCGPEMLKPSFSPNRFHIKVVISMHFHHRSLTTLISRSSLLSSNVILIFIESFSGKVNTTGMRGPPFDLAQKAAISSTIEVNITLISRLLRTYFFSSRFGAWHSEKRFNIAERRLDSNKRVLWFTICRYGELQRGVRLPSGPTLEPPLCALPRQAQSVGPLPR